MASLGCSHSFARAARHDRYTLTSVLRCFPIEHLSLNRSAHTICPEAESRAANEFKHFNRIEFMRGLAITLRGMRGKRELRYVCVL